jgi:hypothetical protein
VALLGKNPPNEIVPTRKKQPLNVNICTYVPMYVGICEGVESNNVREFE